MRPIKPADAVIFAEEETEKAFNSLAENSPLKKSIIKSISNLKENVFCGEKIRNFNKPKDF